MSDRIRTMSAGRTPAVQAFLRTSARYLGLGDDFGSRSDSARRPIPAAMTGLQRQPGYRAACSTPGDAR